MQGVYRIARGTRGEMKAALVSTCLKRGWNQSCTYGRASMIKNSYCVGNDLCVYSAGHLYLKPVRCETVCPIDSFGGKRDELVSNLDGKTKSQSGAFSKGAESACKIITVTVCIFVLRAGMEICQDEM